MIILSTLNLNKIMTSLNKHINEYYQSNKLIGTETFEGSVDSSCIGWENRTFIKEGEMKFKKKYKASSEKPIMVIKYNLQGR